MASKVLSVEIGQTTTRLVEMAQNSANPKVFHAACIDTPPDIMMDGAVQVTEQFVGMIKDCIRANRISTRKTVFVLNSGRIANREITLPAVKDNRIKGLLTANASEYFPVDLDQYELIHDVLDRFTENDAKKMKLSVLAIPKDIIVSYEELAKACGLEIEGLTYVGAAISQMMSREIRGDIKGCLHLHEDAAILTVMDADKVVLQRTVNYGMLDAMAIVADSGRFGVNLTMSDVRRIMQQNICVKTTEGDDDFSIAAAKAAIQQAAVVQGEDGMVPQPDHDGGYGAPQGGAMDDMETMRITVTESLRNLIGSIGRIIDYYQSRNPEKRIERLYLTGFAATCLDFARLLSSELDFRVTNLDKFNKVHYSNAGADTASLVEFFAEIGAGLSSTALSVASDKKSSKGSSDSMAGAALIFGLCLIGSAALVAYATLANMSLKAENLLLNERVNEMMYINEIESNFNNAQKDYDWAIQVDKATQSDNDNLKSFIEELEQKMPSEIRVVTITATETSVSLNVEVSSKKAAATVIRQLRDFDTITVGTVSTIADTENENGGRQVTFSVDCVYVSSATSSAEENTEETAVPKEPADANAADNGTADANAADTGTAQTQNP